MIDFPDAPPAWVRPPAPAPAPSGGQILFGFGSFYIDGQPVGAPQDVGFGVPPFASLLDTLKLLGDVEPWPDSGASSPCTVCGGCAVVAVTSGGGRYCEACWAAKHAAE